MKYKINKCPIVLLKSIFESFDIYIDEAQMAVLVKSSQMETAYRIDIRCLDFHQRDERIWLKPRVSSGYNPLPSKVIRRLQARAISNNGDSTGAIMMMM